MWHTNSASLKTHRSGNYFTVLFTVSNEHISLYLLTLQEHISLMTVNNFVSFFMVGTLLAAFVYQPSEVKESLTLRVHLWHNIYDVF